MNKVELVIFDMDGLMFDTERLSKESWRKIGQKYGYSFDDKLFDTLTGLNIKSTEKVFKDTFGEDFPYDELREEKNGIMENEIESNGIGIKKGLMECIDYLISECILIAVASSSRREIIDYYLEKASLSGKFDYIMSGEEVENGKPYPEIFIKCCEELNVKRENTIVLEDSMNGIKAAYYGDIKVIYIPDLSEVPGKIQKLAYKKIDSLSLVPEIIDSL